jgi:hypothetical protein
MNWKVLLTWGRITCKATATAATVTIEPTTMIQPAIHEVKSPAMRLDHWYTEPASGYWPASSAKHRATQNCPAKTIGHVHHTAGPPKANPNAKSWKTPVRIEM